MAKAGDSRRVPAFILLSCQSRSTIGTSVTDFDAKTVEHRGNLARGVLGPALQVRTGCGAASVIDIAVVQACADR